MKRSEKAEIIGQMLDELYPTTPVPLDHTSAYTLLVAVMLSAQTTDKKVNEVTPALFAAADTPEQMAALEVEKIQALIREIGLAPTKAKNLRKMAEQIVDAGGLRPDWNYLESLAGVGHKTASVLMAQWYGIPCIPSGYTHPQIGSTLGIIESEKCRTNRTISKALWPKETWNKRHLQIIFFGREYCPARNHDLTACPICAWAASKNE